MQRSTCDLCDQQWWHVLVFSNSFPSLNTHFKRSLTVVIICSQNICCIHERWSRRALLRTTQSSEALTFTSIFPGWQLCELFHLHSTLFSFPSGCRKEEEEGVGGSECETVAMVGRGGQVTSQWYHGISSSTWPALHQQPPGPLPTTTRGTYLALTAAERCNPWPMTNTMSAAQHMKLLLYCVQWQLYITRRRKGFNGKG